MPLPKKVTLGPSQVLIEWGDGHRAVHSNKALREACPCALCAGEPPAIGLSRIIPLAPAAPEGVSALKFSMVGRYAISFSWSDGHSTGIYPYDYLLGICECDACAGKRAREKDATLQI
ncbi:MAG: DUF971 domain-containing protein [Thaumarchaeota archaeon]|nr:DUF971 domain-containing protein [Nitrososphaerota archaeon]